MGTEWAKQRLQGGILRVRLTRARELENEQQDTEKERLQRVQQQRTIEQLIITPKGMTVLVEGEVEGRSVGKRTVNWKQKSQRWSDSVGSHRASKATTKTTKKLMIHAADRTRGANDKNPTTRSF